MCICIYTFKTHAYIYMRNTQVYIYICGIYIYIYIRKRFERTTATTRVRRLFCPAPATNQTREIPRVSRHCKRPNGVEGAAVAGGRRAAPAVARRGGIARAERWTRRRRLRQPVEEEESRTRNRKNKTEKQSLKSRLTLEEQTNKNK